MWITNGNKAKGRSCICSENFSNDEKINIGTEVIIIIIIDIIIIIRNNKTIYSIDETIDAPV